MGDPMTNEYYHVVQQQHIDDEFAGAVGKFPIDWYLMAVVCVDLSNGRNEIYSIKPNAMMTAF